MTAIKIDINEKTYQTSNVIHQDIEVKNYIFPGSTLSEDHFSRLLSDLDVINKECITNLTYGLFNPSLTFEQRRELLSESFVVITYQKGRPVASNHGYIYNDSKLELPIFYFGLTQNNSSLKMDLTGSMHMLTVNLLSMHYNEAMVSTITIHPRIAETMDLMTDTMYPSPNYRSKRAPKGYMDYAKKVVESYAIPFWAGLGDVEYDEKRFVLSLTSKGLTGYDKENLEDIVKAEYWMYDLFFEHKLNWDKNEDMLFIGKLTPKIFSAMNKQVTMMIKK